MNLKGSSFRIKESLYIETSTDHVFPLIPAGRRVPTTWEQTFTTYLDGQCYFDLHLLFGLVDDVQAIKTLGKWRIAGIPPAQKGKYLVNVKILLGVDGSVSLSAALKDQVIPVTLLTETIYKIPLTLKVPHSQLDKLVNKPCWDCKSNFVISTSNWKDEPFALCLDCGNEFALPETLAKSVTAPWDEIPPELLRTLGIEPPHHPGGFPPEEIQGLKDIGVNLNPEQNPDLVIDANKIIQQIPGMFFGEKKSSLEIDHEEVLRLAGEPLPEDERRNCPKCDAVISIDAKKCDWCGLVL